VATILAPQSLYTIKEVNLILIGNIAWLGAG
jgi:hypothetical protein